MVSNTWPWSGTRPRLHVMIPVFEHIHKFIEDTPLSILPPQFRTAEHYFNGLAPFDVRIELLPKIMNPCPTRTHT